jgi:hypothetical protein
MLLSINMFCLTLKSNAYDNILMNHKKTGISWSLFLSESYPLLPDKNFMLNLKSVTKI